MYNFTIGQFLVFNNCDIQTQKEIGIINDYCERIRDAVSNLDNDEYDEIYDEIYDENYLKELLMSINHVKEFCCSLFIMRDIYRIKIYDRKSQFDFDVLYKTLHYLFMLTETNLASIESNINGTKTENLKTLIKISYNVIVKYYNEHDMGYDEKSVRQYKERKHYLTTLNEDMNTYKFKHKYLRLYVKKHFTLFSAHLIPGYISEACLNYAVKHLRKYFLNKIEDDAICICKKSTLNFFDARLIEFIKRFEYVNLKSKLNNFFDERWDFVCCYISDKYIIFSPLLLNRNLFAIKTFSKWCHGNDTIFKLFFDFTIPDQFKVAYDEYMTYKIVDLLITSEYIVPSRKTDGEIIPMINIKKYLGEKQLCNDYGDIDVMFYSPHTNYIYVIEYKNVQITPSRYSDLKYDINKMNKWKIYERVGIREKIIKENIDEVIRYTFNKDCVLLKDINGIKSIILTTSPNFYFYQYPTDEFICLDWIAFKQKIKNKDL